MEEDIFIYGAPIQDDPIKLEADLYCAGYPNNFGADVNYASDGD